MWNRAVVAACAVALAACQSEPRSAPPAAEPTATPHSTPTPTATPTATSTATPTATPTASPTPTSPPTSTPPATPDAARLPAPVQAPPVQVTEAVALVPGASTALTADAVTVVDPAATYRITLKGTYPDARLSLLDPGDAMLPAAGAREVAASTTLTLQPGAPLRPGTRYRLRVDGATTREVIARDGTVRAPVELPLLAAGEPPAEPRRSRPKKPRR